jgi:predicted dienelactone hydrolase
MLWHWLTLGLFSLGLVPILSPRPAIGAERISLSYGALRQTVSIGQLETYADTGKISDDLAMYVRLAPSEQLTRLRQILLLRIPVNTNRIAPFLSSPMGEQLLQHLASLIGHNASEFNSVALRAALMQAASDPDGLTLLNVLRQFPTEQVEIDLARTLEVVATWRELNQQTSQAIAQINQQARLKASETILPSHLTDLRRQGRFTWERHTIPLTDQARGRSFLADIYLPLTQQRRPVIIISHGLSSDRFSFAYLAKHLASYGFVVAVLEHPGSNWNHFLAFLNGKTNQIISPREFIDRPLDVSYLLDKLDALSKSDKTFRGRLNLQQIGVIGQSLGGYTALALAGAKLQFGQLETGCQTFQNSLNLSLLLQCRALSLPQRDYDLADPRIKAVVAISPVVSSVLGRTGLSQVKTPVLMIAGSNDLLAPVLLEQIQPFSWLTTSNKYLALVNGGTHFSSVVHAPTYVGFETDLDRAIAQHYVAALSTAFAQTYVANQSNYRPYLSAAYAHSISREQSQLSLVQVLPPAQTSKTLKSFSFSRYLLILGISVGAVRFIWIYCNTFRLKRKG